MSLYVCLCVFPPAASVSVSFSTSSGLERTTGFSARTDERDAGACDIPVIPAFCCHGARGLDAPFCNIRAEQLRLR